MKIPQAQYIDTSIDFTVVLRCQVPPSQMLQRRRTSLATSILVDKTFSYRVGDWCRPNRKSGHRWRGHRVYWRRSCKSNGSDDGTSEQALPRTVVRRFIPGSWWFLQFFVLSVPQGNDASRAVCERVPYVFERFGRVLSQTSSRKVVPATLHWHRSQNAQACSQVSVSSCRMN